MGRRTRGDGSIYKRKDGRWCGKYVDANGKTRYVYGKTKTEVRTKLTKAIADKDAGIVYDAGMLTVAEYLDRWLGSVKDTVRPGAFRRYEESCRIHINPALGRVRLSRLNALQLQTLYRNKLENGLSPRAVQIIHATIKFLLNQMVLPPMIGESTGGLIKEIAKLVAQLAVAIPLVIA